VDFGDAFFGISWIDAILRVLIIVGVMTIVVVYLTVANAGLWPASSSALGRGERAPLGRSRDSPTR
jgi:hypothetical protein